ncbi:hypothetical protein Bresa_01437|uniref:Uncharacterized protein n=1 Tax=Brenneria salicis ATCC 15712 = DSM 30166 TaxID=714314 RepID=A0A366HWM3_9GAMM|nr:hypothetical protein [Brenneria salicis]NMN91280.1 hypothetical protein [Brenneria salicis ATCC 15712 = DSM 30166]RBP56948.1 hypothetical protein DES54_1855 [Brenneria salicis ATCC 15712 = DSM 30166]
MAIQAKPFTDTEVKAAKAIDKKLSLHEGSGLLLIFIEHNESDSSNQPFLI